MGLLTRKRHPIALRQVPAVPSASGIFEDGALTVDPNKGTAAPSLNFDTGAPEGGGFTTAPPLASGHTAAVTITPTSTPEPTPTSESPAASSSVQAASNSSQPIPMSTVIGSCVGAFIGAGALVFLGVWFYRRYSRNLKSQYGSKARGPLNTRADIQRRLSHREPWRKLDESNAADKWEDQAKTEESVGPMEKLTMFKRAQSVRTAYTHTEEEPVQFEMSHPFTQQYSLYNYGQGNASMPVRKPFAGGAPDAHAMPWDDPTQDSFLSVRTQSERLSGSMSPSLTMAIPTPPATSSPHYHWESAEVVNMEGQSVEIVNPFADGNRPVGHQRQKSSGNPFFGAHEDVPRRRSRSNSLASKASRASKVQSIGESTTSSTHIPVPKLDKGKGRAVDPFDDENSPGSTPSFISAASVPHPIITTPTPPVTASNITPTTPLAPPRPAFATHVTSLSNSSVSSNDRALASLLAALDGDATEEEVQARLRIASMQPSVNSTLSMYSDTTEGGDVTKDFPLPPFTPGDSTPTLRSYVTAESDRTVKTR